MSVMSALLSHTFAQALLQAQRLAQLTTQAAVPELTHALPQPGRKASYKAKHSSKTIKMDSTIPVTDGAVDLPPRKRATSLAKLAKLWKWAKAQLHSESELSDIEEEFPESYMDESEDLSDPDYEINDREKSNPSRDTLPVKPTKIE
ncbi:Hypothetical predicted protein, partial [Pelobates cultripes]